MMPDYAILALRDHPEWLDRAVRWFHENWGVPAEAYRESMEACLAGPGPVPQWYIAVAAGGIAGGLGVIENDFHERRDLTPNICAVFVEPAWRGQGLARVLLDHACREFARFGVDTLYLLTDHIGFYERCGWTYYGPVRGDGAEQPSRMYVRRTATEGGPEGARG